jgi:hypothetical protein
VCLQAPTALLASPLLQSCRFASSIPTRHTHVYLRLSFISSPSVTTVFNDGLSVCLFVFIYKCLATHHYK